MDSPAGSFESKCNGIIAAGQVWLCLPCFGPIYPQFAPAAAPAILHLRLCTWNCAPQCAPEIVHPIVDLRLCKIWWNRCMQSICPGKVQSVSTCARLSSLTWSSCAREGWNHCIWPSRHGSTYFANLLHLVPKCAPELAWCSKSCNLFILLWMKKIEIILMCQWCSIIFHVAAWILKQSWLLIDHWTVMPSLMSISILRYSTVINFDVTQFNCRAFCLVLDSLTPDSHQSYADWMILLF